MKITDSMSNSDVMNRPQRLQPELTTRMVNQESENIEPNKFPIVNSKEKLEEAVHVLNEFKEFQNRSLKFVLHEGLEEYYVQVINTASKEVIREIPSKKLLDTFYTMQKFLGMIVDEKI